MLVPRLSTPLWGAPGNDMIARTGLGDRMAPGTMTELLIDDSPGVPRRFRRRPPPPPAQRYFRAIVLWDFDGAAWSRGRTHDYGRADEVRSNSATLDYTITLEPTDRRWLPALDLPLDAPPRRASARIAC